MVAAGWALHRTDGCVVVEHGGADLVGAWNALPDVLPLRIVQASKEVVTLDVLFSVFVVLTPVGL